MDVTIACPCPPKADGATRHPDGDTVVLRERLDSRAATTVRKAIGLVSEDGPADSAEILAVMTEWYCLLGIEAWTLTDAKGKPLAVTRATIREAILEAENAVEQASVIADAADGLYMAAVLLPFTGPGVEVLAAFADGTIDISAEGLPGEAPEAIEAILDHEYPDGRHRDDYLVARWRLQFLAERDVGRHVRMQQRTEDRSVSGLRKVANGGG